ncbi:hypothetical protein ID866_12237 [Astraeus odoratus]|nr:hypothetical protein ID866_12237 [Astraeus odoratus]
MDDPNLAVALDFAALEFLEVCQHFLDAGRLEQQAIDALTHVWACNSDRDKVTWARRQQEHLQALEETCQREELLRQQHEEEAQLLCEECKKNKAKFAPIPDIGVAAEPIILPSQVAICKLQQHKFCKLWYFTNQGLKEASFNLSYALDNDTLAILPSADGSTTLVPTSVT